MKIFQEIKDEISSRKGKKFKFLPVSVYNEAAELYASQFKVVSPEPTEEEMDDAWNDWHNANGGNNTGTAWDDAIAWYKTKIGRS